MITDNKMGGRRVELFIPFRVGDEDVIAVTFGPWKMDYTLRWEKGEWVSLLAVMATVADVKEEVLRELRSPDDERVISAFLGMVPPEVRNQVAQGMVPRRVEEEPYEGDEVYQPPAEEVVEQVDEGQQGGGEGELLGFDLGERRRNAA
jgi:hypothetical protein